jgi:hypothetical protein
MTFHRPELIIAHSPRHAARSRAQRPLPFRSISAWPSCSAARTASSAIATDVARSCSSLSTHRRIISPAASCACRMAPARSSAWVSASLYRFLSPAEPVARREPLSCFQTLRSSSREMSGRSDPAHRAALAAMRLEAEQGPDLLAAHRAAFHAAQQAAAEGRTGSWRFTL